MKTSLGIWALGDMVTRFVPGGDQPEHGKGGLTSTDPGVREEARRIGMALHIIHMPRTQGIDNYAALGAPAA